MSNYYWCSKCERAFNKDGTYNGRKVKPGRIGGYYCPFCGASYMETLDWQSFIFGPGSPNNYPAQPIDGQYYPLYPTI